MASLRTMVGRFRDELREGVAYVAFWKNGESWGAEAFWLDPGYFADYGDAIEDYDAREMRQIINTDLDAVIINGRENAPFKDYKWDEESAIGLMTDYICRRYVGHHCQLSEFYALHSKAEDELETQPIITAKRKEEELTPTEDKQRICNALAPVLRLTRNLDDLVSLHYDPKTEKVEATFLDGYTKTANVAADSGIAMIRDIIQQIV